MSFQERSSGNFGFGTMNRHRDFFSRNQEERSSTATAAAASYSSPRSQKRNFDENMQVDRDVDAVNSVQVNKKPIVDYNANRWPVSNGKEANSRQIVVAPRDEDEEDWDADITDKSTSTRTTTTAPQSNSYNDNNRTTTSGYQEQQQVKGRFSYNSREEESSSSSNANRGFSSQSRERYNSSERSNTNSSWSNNRNNERSNYDDNKSNSWNRGNNETRSNWNDNRSDDRGWNRGNDNGQAKASWTSGSNQNRSTESGWNRGNDLGNWSGAGNENKSSWNDNDRGKSNERSSSTSNWNSNNARNDDYQRKSIYDKDFSTSDFNKLARPGFGYGTSSNETTSEQPKPTINWSLVRSMGDQSMEKFKDHPAIIKDFYNEPPKSSQMSYEEAVEFRKKNFNIKVELFKKSDLSYCTNRNKLPEKERTPEEIEEYLRERVPNPFRTFHEGFSAYPELLEQLKIQKFKDPTPIQSQMWPILLKGLDCVGIAQTGTGKTLAFLLPALIHIDGQSTPRSQRIGPNVLVLSPTRELALQIEQEVKKINYKGIKSVCIYGGGDRKEQMNVCSQGVEIIIGTPGRLYDLIRAGVINVTSVTYLVMDEADRMLDLGFEPQIMKILLDIRPDRQTIMTSATWPEGVRRLATKYLHEPIQLYVDTLDLRAAKSVEQHLVMLDQDEDKKERLMDYIENRMQADDKVIVFVSRKTTADNLSCDLILKDIQCQSIHGDREQADREQALDDFKNSHVRILIATDVASRGIDVKDITCVYNYDFPHNMEEYVHRVGRTGRAGRTGMSITLMARQDWKHAKELIEILQQGEQEVPHALVDMAQRYEAMKLRRQEEGGDRRGGGGGRGRGGGGGFGRGGGRGGGGRSGFGSFF